MRRSIGRSLSTALLLATTLAASGRQADAQLNGYQPQFPYAGAQAAPSPGSNQPGSVAQWLGADGGSLAVFPDGTSTFWAFGDTYIGPNGAQNRAIVAPAVVNTMAIGYIQSGQFNPYYYYRGNYTYNANYYPTNNPSAFFLDPLNQNPNNTGGTRFWVGKAIFYGNKLFVFLLRIQSNGTPLATVVARVNNPSDAYGHPTNPFTWSIDYLTLSDAASPSFLAEAFYDSQNMVVYGVYPGNAQTPNRTFATKIPLTTLYNAANGSDISGSIQYLNTAGQWASSGVAGNPIGPIASCWDVAIPTTGGFTIRYNSAKAMWQTVYVDTTVANNPWASVKQSTSPFGPWSAPVQFYKFPEMDPTNALYNSTVFCYSPYEIPAFESNPNSTLKITYSCTRESSFPPGVVYGSPAAFAYDNNYYRVKVSVEVPNPLP